MSDPAVICLMGATATGKTDLAVEIAKRFPVEIISVDSALIYRGMDIGTAKPGATLLERAPHFLIDIVDPAENYSAWNFVQDSRALINEISRRGNTPLLVGGTMMYYNVLEQGLNSLPEADEAIRAKLDGEAQLIGWMAMHARLTEVDPESASRIKPGDSQRIQRALEVFELSGLAMSALQSKEKRTYRGEMVKLILNADDRSALHERIENRFREMLTAGFIDEVVKLRARGDLSLTMPSMRCVGYRQVWQYLDGEFEKQEMVDKAVAATRQLAKRQMTWLRKQPQKNTFDCLNYRKDAIFKMLDEAFRS
ncbi:MAG: tRNA (adenosine(37)-N6)-dimethylallyltransferase MiaA [Gammaproteobacteria bacterium]|nr:tRNA (adenosine(37)-N6)-dimethylallyltransferase MiaA [Gammaproteobacteria bacterium]